MNLPGVCAISIRGTAPLPAVVSDTEGFHWGDDIVVDERSGEIDPDPGFEKATELVLEKVVKEVLLEKLGWETSDILIFGFGQGGSLGLSMATKLWNGGEARVEEITESGEKDEREKKKAFKGVVSIGGGLPVSTVSTKSGRDKSATKILLVQMDDESQDMVKREFVDVSCVKWAREDVGMPRNRDEMFPIMKFFADRLNSGW